MSSSSLPSMTGGFSMRGMLTACAFSGGSAGMALTAAFVADAVAPPGFASAVLDSAGLDSAGVAEGPLTGALVADALLPLGFAAAVLASAGFDSAGLSAAFAFEGFGVS